MFGTALRKAADSSQPLNRRVTNLAHAVGKFPIFGFQGTLKQLNLVTGSTPQTWTPAQIDQAVKLLSHAHESWASHARRTALKTREAKRLPGYRPVDGHVVFESWRDEYFDAERSSEWMLEHSDVLQNDLERRRWRAENRAAFKRHPS